MLRPRWPDSTNSVSDVPGTIQFATRSYREWRPHTTQLTKPPQKDTRTGSAAVPCSVPSSPATLKTELIQRQPWPTRRATKDAGSDYIEGSYNPY